MRTPVFDATTLLTLFRRRKMATMSEMKAALGTAVDRTVFRKLNEVPYHSSYSHRGQFYTLDSVAAFDDRGLWTCRGVHFSRFGTLIDTVEQFVTQSDRGWSSSELTRELHVAVKQPLLTLVRTQRVVREDISGHYVYCATNRATRTAQLRQRGRPPTAAARPGLHDSLAQTADETTAALMLFFSTLDERQRRLYAGLESLRLGHGGDSRIAALTGLDVHTIAKGRSELLQRDVQLERIRRPGAGRQPLEKQRQRLSTRSKR